MRAAGVICEYNPFHKGHALHLAQTREQLGPDCGVVCVMSGNYVQRGEPALFGKHARAEAAVLGGADLVLELPLPWAAAPAERFAAGGVALLDRLGVCTYLSFGSEAGTLAPLLRAAEALRDPSIDLKIRAALADGASYAAARQAAVQALIGPDAAVLTEPNNILAVEYLLALAARGSKMKPLTMSRTGAAHNGLLPESGLASASHIRSLFASGGDPWPYLAGPAAARFRKEMEAGRGPVLLEALETAMLARLRTLPDEAFAALPGNAEGLSDRLRRNARTEPDLRSVLDKTVTRRYPRSRIRRMLLCAYLGVTAADQTGEPPYARVLALNGRGRGLLREIQKNGKIPVLTKPAAAVQLPADAARIFRLEALATDLYVLGYPSAAERAGGAEWKTSPVILEEESEQCAYC